MHFLVAPSADNSLVPICSSNPATIIVHALMSPTYYQELSQYKARINEARSGSLENGQIHFDLIEHAHSNSPFIYLIN